MGRIDDVLECPNCGASNEGLYYWTEDCAFEAWLSPLSGGVVQ